MIKLLIVRHSNERQIQGLLIPCGWSQELDCTSFCWFWSYPRFWPSVILKSSESMSLSELYISRMSISSKLRNLFWNHHLFSLHLYPWLIPIEEYMFLCFSIFYFKTVVYLRDVPNVYKLYMYVVPSVYSCALSKVNCRKLNVAYFQRIYNRTYTLNVNKCVLALSFMTNSEYKSNY